MHGSMNVSIIAAIVIIVVIYHYSFCFAVWHGRGTIYNRTSFCGTPQQNSCTHIWS